MPSRAYCTLCHGSGLRSRSRLLVVCLACYGGDWGIYQQAHDQAFVGMLDTEAGHFRTYSATKRSHVDPYDTFAIYDGIRKDLAVEWEIIPPWCNLTWNSCAECDGPAYDDYLCGPCRSAAYG